MALPAAPRDGLERLQVADNLSIGGLKAAINEQLGVPLEGMVLSQDSRLVRSWGRWCPCSAHSLRQQQGPPWTPKALIRAGEGRLGAGLSSAPCCRCPLQLTSKDGGVTFLDLSEDSAQLGEVGVRHGDMVRCSEEQAGRREEGGELSRD